ncbi:tetratricopeptide repeat protein [bacterium]|nr:tetratricopeptide repeat protein [bacterium]
MGSPLFQTGDFKIGLVLFVLALVVFGNSLNNPFIWDDDYLIVGNAQVKSGSALATIFNSDIMLGGGHHQSKFYRPLQIVSFKIDYFIWGEDPVGFHVTSTMVHIINALLVLVLVRSLCADHRIALFASVLFLVHPVQTESVTYLASRSEILMFFFYLSALIMYRQYRSYGSYGYLALSLVLFAGSLLSKEMAVSLPLTVLILDLVWFDSVLVEDRILKRYLPYFLVLCAYFYLRLFVLELQTNEISTYGTLPENYATSLMVRLLTFIKVLSSYVWILLYPKNLFMERSIDSGMSLADPVVFIPVLIVVVLGAGAVMISRRSLWSLIWFFLTLLPVSGLVPINYLLAERYLYLPTVGFFGALGIIVFGLYDRSAQKWRPWLKPVGVGLICVGLITLMTRTVVRNHDWHDELVFYQKTIEHVPGSTRLYNNLGTEYGKRGRYHEAIRAFQQAIDILDDYVDPHNNLGYAYYHIGNYDKAIAEFARVVQLGDRPHSVYQQIVADYIKQGDDQKALSVYRAFGSTEAVAYNSLAMDYYGLKRYQQAIKFMEHAIELDPYHAETLVSLGSIHAELKQYDRARFCWEKALAINPRLDAARTCLERLERLEKPVKTSTSFLSGEGATDGSGYGP